MAGRVMAYSTSQLRSLWRPACNGKGNVYLTAYNALNQWLFVYGYRPRAADTGAYNCRPITGGSDWSLHAYGPGSSFRFWNGITIATSLAVDINWQSNPYGPRLVTDMPREMVDAIERVRTNSGHQVWGWGGYYSGNKDAMHYEIVCSPAQLATGINPRTLPGPAVEEFHLSTEQYNTIMRKLAELDVEATKRHSTEVGYLSRIENHVNGLVSTIRSSGKNVANAFRRIMGVPISTDNTIQARHDSTTGTKVQNKLNAP